MKKMLIFAAVFLATAAAIYIAVTAKKIPGKKPAKEKAPYKIEYAKPAPAKKRGTKPVPAKPTAPSGKKPRIAIVVDDFGYTTGNLDDFYSIGLPLTFSILPNLEFSGYVAESARSRGYEVILHLPMEAQNGSLNKEKNTILTTMTASEISRILDESIDSVPGIKGVSNHTGSKATENEAVMRTVLTDLKKRKLYFLDSKSTANSVCLKAAKATGIMFAERDIFLDNESNPAYIKGYLDKLVEKARARGYAIGICHDRPVTAQVMKEMLPKLAKEGIEFVPASRLAEDK